jgi:hypothetical protein
MMITSLHANPVTEKVTAVTGARQEALKRTRLDYNIALNAPQGHGHAFDPDKCGAHCG